MWIILIGFPSNNTQSNDDNDGNSVRVLYFMFNGLIKSSIADSSMVKTYLFTSNMSNDCNIFSSAICHLLLQVELVTHLKGN